MARARGRGNRRCTWRAHWRGRSCRINFAPSSIACRSRRSSAKSCATRPEDMRMLLYRRMMLRIAELIARRDRALALVTGDSLGQVASQTLRNLVAVDAAARMPVFRPLIGTDKMEILATARKIGTYDISSEPFHDCCPVFMPRTAGAIGAGGGAGRGGSEARCLRADCEGCSRGDARAVRLHRRTRRISGASAPHI